MDFSGQVALVTGASRGLGFATAEALGAAGAHVVALARTVGGLEDLDEAIKAEGGSATLVPLDITDDAGLERLGAAVHERWGRVDLWLHTAAYAPPQSPAEHIGHKELDTALSVNVRAFQRLIRVVDPLLRLSADGRAVIVSEPGTGVKFQGLYGATKAAQSALARSWGAEVSRRFTVAEVVPPPMPTALRGRFFPGEGRDALTSPKAVASRLVSVIPTLAPGGRVVLDDA